jgi:hypothetical protein
MKIRTILGMLLLISFVAGTTGVEAACCEEDCKHPDCDGVCDGTNCKDECIPNDYDYDYESPGPHGNGKGGNS